MNVDFYNFLIGQDLNGFEEAQEEYEEASNAYFSSDERITEEEKDAIQNEQRRVMKEKLSDIFRLAYGAKFYGYALTSENKDKLHDALGLYLSVHLGHSFDWRVLA